MLTAGARLGEFEANPVMLFNHLRPSGNAKDQVLPIGFWDDIKMNAGTISAVPVFDDNDAFAMSIYHKVEHGTLRMASVGAKPNSTSNDPAMLLPLQLKETVTDWTMKEASIVDIGSNPDALAVVLYDSNDNVISLTDHLIPTIIPTMTKEEQAAHDAAQVAKADNAVALAAETEATLVQLRAENSTLTAEIAALKTQGVKDLAIALVDGAEIAGKLIAAEKAPWLALAESNYDAAKKAINALPGHVSAQERIAGNKAGNGDGKLALLAAKDFDMLFKTGELAYVKLHDNEMYKEKYLAKFGKEPASN